MSKDKDEISEEKSLKEEMRRLKEEMESLKQQLGEMTDRIEKRRKGIHIDINDRLAGVSDYVNDMMAGVAEGIEGEIEKSVLIHATPQGIIMHRGRHHDREPPKRMEKPDLNKAANTMSALGQEHRLKILGELMTGGKYISDLQNVLAEITTSTLSSHLDVLQEAELVVQERVRGRYLITIPGRIAYKMAEAIARQRDRHTEETTHGYSYPQKTRDEEAEENDDENDEESEDHSETEE